MLNTADVIEYFRMYPQIFTFWVVISFVFGCCIGSFLNVCIWRVPRGMSIISPPSHCPKCDYKITALENIPLLSWIFLGGKCSSCHAPITIRYFLVELMTGLLFALIFLKVIAMQQPIAVLLPYFVMAAILICSAFTDCELGIIPNEFTYFGMICGVAFAALFPSAWDLDSRVAALLLSLVSMLAAGGLMALCAVAGKKIFRREALGWGDVKFIAAAGALTGLPGALFTVLAGSLAGLAGAPFLRLIPKYRKRRTLRFGPFLAFGMLIWIFFGDVLVRMYMRILN